MDSKSRWLAGSSRTKTLGVASAGGLQRLSVLLRPLRARPAGFLYVVAGKRLRLSAYARTNALSWEMSADPLFGAGVFWREVFLVVLGEVARTRLIAPFDLLCVGCQFAHGDLQQCRFTDAVGSHNGWTIASLHEQIDAVQNLIFVERFLYAGSSTHRGHCRAAVQSETSGSALSFGQFDYILGHLFHHALFVAGLPRLAGFGLKAVDKLLVMRDFSLSVRNFFFAPLSLQLFGLCESAVMTLIHRDGLIVYVENVRADII